MKFDKYEKLGDYHWQFWKAKLQPYASHAAFVADWVKERPCLDIGCGDGLISFLLGKNVLGVDSNQLGVNYARAHGVKAFLGDAYSLKVTPGFKAVLMADVIEHLEFPEKALKEAHRVLEPSGFLYISTPPKHEPPRVYHYREYSPDELVKLVTPVGFSLVGAIVIKDGWVEMYGKFQKV